MTNAERIAKLETVMYLACKVSLDICDTCDLQPSTCNGGNIDCPNRELRKAIQEVRADETA